MHPKKYSFLAIGFITLFFISCSSGARITIKDHHYSVSMPPHFKRMADKDRYETNIPIFVGADMVFTNQVDFNVPNKKDPEAAPTPNTVFVFFSFQKNGDCKKVYDSTFTSLSQAGDMKELDEKNPETFLGSLMRGVTYVNSNSGMLLYMDQSHFDQFIALFYLTDGVLEITMYGHDASTSKLLKLKLEKFMQIIESVQIEPGKIYNPG